MAHSMHRDPRVRALPWKDLSELEWWQVAAELLLPLPWLLASLWSASAGFWLVALPASFMVFLTGLRVGHGAQHYTLGLGRRATEWVMFALSLVMLGSMHAVQVNHLRHHKYCLGADDMEARSAHLPAWQALLYGPKFAIEIILHGYRQGRTSQRRWLIAEIVASSTWACLALAALPWQAARYHVVVMLLGQCLTAFFAVWTVHHGCDEQRFVARTLRNGFWNRVSYNMFLHVEHHLFPKVPTRHLHRLAERLDHAAPEIGTRLVW